MHQRFFCKLACGFWLATLLMGSGILYSQSLHVFSVVESNDINRPDRLIDAQRIEKSSTLISKYLGLDKYLYNFGDNNAFSVNSFHATVRRLGKVSCTSDVIWFHFSGYGRNDGQSKWPVLKLTDGEIDPAEVISALQQKHPKLLLITIDAGNKRAETKAFSNQIGDEPGEAESAKVKKLKTTAISPQISLPTMREMPHFSLIENYERLFKQFDGMRVIILSSCSVGQNSISNTTVGSEWLMQFCKTLEQMTDEYTRSASWDKIHKQVLTEIQNKFKNKQIPQASIKTISVDCETTDNDHE